MRYSQAKAGMFVSLKFDSPTGGMATMPHLNGTGMCHPSIDRRRLYLLLQEVGEDGFSGTEVSTGKEVRFVREKKDGRLTGRFQPSKVFDHQSLNFGGWLELKEEPGETVAHLLSASRTAFETANTYARTTLDQFERGAALVAQQLPSPA